MLGADGIDGDGVLSSTDEDTAQLARTVVEHSDRVYVLADSRKLGRPSFVSYGRLRRGRVITLVTDAGIPAALLSNWRRRGFEILIAENASNGGNGKSKSESEKAEAEAKA